MREEDEEQFCMTLDMREKAGIEYEPLPKEMMDKIRGKARRERDVDRELPGFDDDKP